MPASRPLRQSRWLTLHFIYIYLISWLINRFPI
jgi:hypothetical protein